MLNRAGYALPLLDARCTLLTSRTRPRQSTKWKSCRKRFITKVAARQRDTRDGKEARVIYDTCFISSFLYMFFLIHLRTYICVFLLYTREMQVETSKTATRFGARINIRALASHPEEEKKKKKNTKISVSIRGEEDEPPFVRPRRERASGCSFRSRPATPARTCPPILVSSTFSSAYTSFFSPSSSSSSSPLPSYVDSSTIFSAFFFCSTRGNARTHRVWDIGCVYTAAHGICAALERIEPLLKHR